MRANRTIVEAQPLVGGHKQRADVGLKVGCKDTKDVGKREKKNHVLSLNDTEELAEADV